MRSSPSLTRDGARVHTQCSCHPAGATATGAGRTSEQVSEWHQSQASCTVAFTPTLWELGWLSKLQNSVDEFAKCLGKGFCSAWVVDVL
jgi:hypothetical protein